MTFLLHSSFDITLGNIIFDNVTLGIVTFVGVVVGKLAEASTVAATGTLCNG
jgi:hypothetical protein